MLRGPANSHLSVIGQFTGTLSHKSTQSEQEIRSEESQDKFTWITSFRELQLVERLHNICTSPDSIRQLGVSNKFNVSFRTVTPVVRAFKHKLNHWFLLSYQVDHGKSLDPICLNTTYILVVDYFSRYVEILKLSTTTSASIIVALKTIFSRHGIPETLVTDHGPQYSSEEFCCFSVSYDFTHATSSPYYPRGNGESERAVKTVKNFLKDSNDPHIAVLTYRATPLPWCGISPAELLMGRKPRTSERSELYTSVVWFTEIQKWWQTVQEEAEM